MVAKYSVDVLRHWSCRCDESEALAFRSTLAASGLEVPASDTSWTIVVGEPEQAGSDVGAWQHVIGVLVKGKRDGMSKRDAERADAVISDLSIVVATLNAREAAQWAELVAAAPEPVAEVAAPEPEPVVAPTPEPVVLEHSVESVAEVKPPQRARRSRKQKTASDNSSEVTTPVSEVIDERGEVEQSDGGQVRD